jgi:hypothetical protein
MGAIAGCGPLLLTTNYTKYTKYTNEIRAARIATQETTYWVVIYIENVAVTTFAVSPSTVECVTAKKGF